MTETKMYGGVEEYIALVRQLNEQRTAMSGNKLKAFIQTFGCQQNEADSEKLAGMAVAMGYEPAGTPDGASLIIVNTCAIRQHAEEKALSVIGQFKHIKSRDPSVLIAVCGCMVSQEHRKSEIKHSYPYVDIVFGTSSIHRLPELVFKRLSGGGRLFCPEESRTCIAENIPVKRESPFHAWVSVMYGCNNFCSYCIVPYVRGRERSRRPQDILKEVRELAASGCKDITLLGQNVNSYGKDLGTGYDFADLIRDISDIEGDFCLRFMTSHPKDATQKLIDVLAASGKAAHHFHLPLQSGSDRILNAMNRHYDREKYLSTVGYMRKMIPDIALTTDIIVGFPGETDEDFEDTLDMLRKVRFDMIFSFIYSPRKGTPAALMENQIPEDVKSRRFARLLEVQNAISAEINEKMLDSVVRVLCDGVSKTDPSVMSGRTEGNKIVFFEGSPDDAGKFINIKIDRTEAFALYGHKN
jgi:tRNA-2-methylthio-N6-dimethylallyladenosine synthase